MINQIALRLFRKTTLLLTKNILFLKKCCGVLFLKKVNGLGSSSLCTSPPLKLGVYWLDILRNRQAICTCSTRTVSGCLLRVSAGGCKQYLSTISTLCWRVACRTLNCIKCLVTGGTLRLSPIFYRLCVDTLLCLV